MQTKLTLLLAFAFAALVVCSGGVNNGFSVSAPQNPGNTVFFYGAPILPPASLYSSVKENGNCGAGAEDCIGEQEYGDSTAEGAGVGLKQGESCASSVLGLFASGDVGLKAAADNGGITRVRSIDVQRTHVLSSLYQQTCILVNGD